VFLSSSTGVPKVDRRYVAEYGHTVLWESMAINLYLAQKPGLMHAASARRRETSIEIDSH